MHGSIALINDRYIV